MITFSKLKSSTIENGKRILKILQFGAKTAKEAYPFGFDSVPPENWTAIYAETSNSAEPVIIGYINKNQLAEVGESRQYSIDESGNLKAYVYCRSDGSLELNGNQYTGVRFSALQTATNNTNTLINAELTKLVASISALGGVYVMSEISTDLSATESPTVKLK